MKRVSFWYLAALVWGVISAVISLLALAEHHVGVPLGIRVLLDVIPAAIIFMAGRAAKRQGAKPVGAGVVAGIVFGLTSGWGAMFAHVTRAELIRTLHGRTVTSAEMDAALKYANSAAVHIVSWGATLFVGVLMGLILGAIGGATAQPPSATQDV